MVFAVVTMGDSVLGMHSNGFSKRFFFSSVIQALVLAAGGHLKL